MVLGVACNVGDDGVSNRAMDYANVQVGSTGAGGDRGEGDMTTGDASGGMDESAGTSSGDCQVDPDAPGGCGDDGTPVCEDDVTGSCPADPAPLHCWKDLPTPGAEADMVASGFRTSSGEPAVALYLGDRGYREGNRCTIDLDDIYQLNACDGRTICVRHFTGQDDIAPTGTAPEGARDLNCLSDVPEPNAADVGARFTDNCSTPFPYHINREVTGDDCSGFTVRDMYHVYDDCFNFTVVYVEHTGGGPGLCASC